MIRMKKALSIFLSAFILLQMLCVFSLEKVEAAAPTKTVTHTIAQSSWSRSKDQGPATYHYDDGLFYGTLTRTSTTWETRQESTSQSWTQYSNSSFEGDDPPTSYYYYKNHYESNGYSNVSITKTEWDGSTEGPGSYTYDTYEGTYPNGEWVTHGPYKYRRGFRVYFNYDTYRYTSNYSGVVTARTIPPVIKISNPIANFKYHNQNEIIVWGFIKDEDKGDKNFIYYSIEGTSHINKTVNLTNPTQIIATGNDMFFQGNIQLDQTIIPGKYRLEIWAKDDKGADSNTIEIPIEIYNVLENIQNDIEKYIPIGKESDLRLVIPNTKDTILSSTINVSVKN